MQSGEVPQEVFLDVNRCHEVEWKPSVTHPLRYFDEEQRVSVTTHEQKVQKVTRWDDETGLSYLATTVSGEAKADGRGVQSHGQTLHLYDGAHEHVIHTRESWQLVPAESRSDWKPPATSWRDCFALGVPELSSEHAFSAVLLYPEDAQIIGEKESQPFIFDYVDDFLEEQAELRQFREMADDLLVVRCEASLGACLKYERPQRYTIWYEWPEFAQKHAQGVWNTLHRQNSLAWLPNFKFSPVSQQPITGKYPLVDWMNVWIPFSVYDDHHELKQWSTFIANHLVPGGISCVAGPRILGHWLEEQGLSIIYAEQGESLPTFKIHQAILQASRLHPDLTIWIIQQS